MDGWATFPGDVGKSGASNEPGEPGEAGPAEAALPTRGWSPSDRTRATDPPRKDRGPPLDMVLLHSIAMPGWAALAGYVVSGRVYGTLVPDHLLLAWYGITVSTGAVCAGVSLWLRVRSSDGGRSGALRPLLGVALCAVWALLPWFAWSPDPVNRVGLITVTLAVGMAIMARQSSHPWLFRIGNATLLVPLIVRFLAAGRPGDIAVAGALAVFGGWIAFSGELLIRATMRSRGLRTLNGDLAASLIAARDTAIAERIKADHASRAKSDFLSHMSHELRTPLNAVIGFSDLLMTGLAGPLSQRQTDYVTDIHDAGRHLLDLITDVLDLSKIEAGMVELDLDDVAIDDVVDSVMSMMKVRAAAAGIELARLPARTGLALRADQLRLKQILINLVTNAIKFSHRGDTVRIAIAETDNQIILKVIDRGIGIATEDIPKAFEPFRQIHDSGIRRHEGTGLGLPLSNHLVTLHGGELRLESARGVGTSAIVTLPRPPACVEGVNQLRDFVVNH